MSRLLKISVIVTGAVNSRFRAVVKCVETGPLENPQVTWFPIKFETESSLLMVWLVARPDANARTCRSTLLVMPKDNVVSLLTGPRLLPSFVGVEPLIV